MKSPLLSPSDCMTLVIVAYLIIYLLSLLRIELLNMSTMSLAHYNLSPKCLGDQRMAPRYVWMFIEKRLRSYFLLLSQLNIDLHFLNTNSLSISYSFLR